MTIKDAKLKALIRAAKDLGLVIRVDLVPEERIVPGLSTVPKKVRPQKVRPHRSRVRG